MTPDFWSPSSNYLSVGCNLFRSPPSNPGGLNYSRKEKKIDLALHIITFFKSVWFISDIRTRLSWKTLVLLSRLYNIVIMYILLTHMRSRVSCPCVVCKFLHGQLLLIQCLSRRASFFPPRKRWHYIPILENNNYYSSVLSNVNLHT